MTDEQPAAAPVDPPPPAEVMVDQRKAFAFAMVQRRHRFIEACSDCKLEPAAALEIMKDPEWQANIDRLISTGEYAGEVMEAREMLEITTSIARTTVAEFISTVMETGTNERGEPKIGTQSIPAFLATRLRAVALLASMKYGKHGDLKQLIRALEKNRKTRGQAMDRTAIHRKVSSVLAGGIKAE